MLLVGACIAWLKSFTGTFGGNVSIHVKYAKGGKIVSKTHDFCECWTKYQLVTKDLQQNIIIQPKRFSFPWGKERLIVINYSIKVTLLFIQPHYWWEPYMDYFTWISVAGSRISRRGGRGPSRGGVDSQGGYVSKILCVKTKKSGPLGGRALGICQCRSANGFTQMIIIGLTVIFTSFEIRYVTVLNSG